MRSEERVFSAAAAIDASFYQLNYFGLKTKNKNN